MGNIDTRLSRICNRLKQIEQQAQDMHTEVLEELNWLMESAPNREDITNLRSDIINKIKKDGSEHWQVVDKWSKHFDELVAGDTESD